MWTTHALNFELPAFDGIRRRSGKEESVKYCRIVPLLSNSIIASFHIDLVATTRLLVCDTKTRLLRHATQEGSLDPKGFVAKK